MSIAKKFKRLIFDQSEIAERINILYRHGSTDDEDDLDELKTLWNEMEEEIIEYEKFIDSCTNEYKI